MKPQLHYGTLDVRAANGPAPTDGKDKENDMGRYFLNRNADLPEAEPGTTPLNLLRAHIKTNKISIKRSVHNASKQTINLNTATPSQNLMVIRLSNDKQILVAKKPPVPRFQKICSENQIKKSPRGVRPLTAKNGAITDFTPKKEDGSANAEKPVTALSFINNFLGQTFYSGGADMKRYEIGQVLGKGSYAVVKLAKDLHTNQQVAIKTYDKFRLIDQQKKTNVRRYFPHRAPTPLSSQRTPPN